MISPQRIKWMGISSLEMDVHTHLSFEGDSGDVETALGREAVISETYNNTFKRPHGYSWNNDFAPTVTFIKNDFSDITPEENRKILTWLTRSKNASFLDVYHDDSEVISYSILGNWTSISQYKMGNGRVVGIIATFDSAFPWALSPLRTVTKEFEETEIVLDDYNAVHTDCPEDAIYPRITIKQNEVTSVVEMDHVMTEEDEWVDGTVYHHGGTYYWRDAKGVKQTSATKPTGIETTSVTITNVYDDESKSVSTTVKNNIKGETVVLDGANRIVSSDRMSGRIFGDDFDWDWLPLFNGSNKISVIGNCKLTLEWREPIKCGSL